MTDKIFPRNLTARADYRVPGNPASTRLESGVGNCYPGLEFDHRNLDRRFFPGLVFEFIAQNDASAAAVARSGARLVEVVTDDPDLTPDPAQHPDRVAPAAALLKALQDPAQADLADGTWFLSAIEQGGRRIEMSAAGTDGQSAPLDGMVVWRLVRCLEPGPVTIWVARRAAPTPDVISPTAAGAVTARRSRSAAPAADTSALKLIAWRRQYVDSTTGVISRAYAAGELTQSLCSPWQHDFRDCGCHYWASNHPDIVLAEERPREQPLPSGESEDPARSQTRIDWLRSDRARARAAAALGTIAQNRPFQMDHYEINQRWQELSIVVGDHEIPPVYFPRSADSASPFASSTELAQQLSYLATLEHVLALEYLYALFSVRGPDEQGDVFKHWLTLRDDVTFIRHIVLLIAVGEMLHLRWANQLLWELADAGLIKRADFGPQLGVAAIVPVSAAGGPRPRALRPLTREVLADFIAVEQPSGFIEGQYARVTATLRQKEYPDTLYQLASRIVNEGMDHFNRFRDLAAVLREYPVNDPPYLRSIKLGDPKQADVRKALGLYQTIKDELTKAYARGLAEDRAHIVGARQAMTELSAVTDRLAAGGIGVPFFS